MADILWKARRRSGWFWHFFWKCLLNEISLFTPNTFYLLHMWVYCSNLAKKKQNLLSCFFLGDCVGQYIHSLLTFLILFQGISSCLDDQAGLLLFVDCWVSESDCWLGEKAGTLCCQLGSLSQQNWDVGFSALPPILPTFFQQFCSSWVATLKLLTV